MLLKTSNKRLYILILLRNRFKYVYVTVIYSNKYCHITGEGLLSLAISLIATGGLQPTANKLQELGPLILIKLIKNKPEAAGQALKMIRDKLGSESVNVHHIAGKYYLLYYYYTVEDIIKSI